MASTATIPTGADDESRLWLPPNRLRRYERAKLIGGVLIAVIFLGWLVVQWSNPFVRYLSIALLLTTAWVLLSSTIADRVRARGRQIAVDGRSLHITTPTGQRWVALDQVAAAQWHDGPQPAAGLWFYDEHRQAVAHLDLYFLADDVEARTFVGWLRRQTGVALNVRWPREDDAACPAR